MLERMCVPFVFRDACRPAVHPNHIVKLVKLTALNIEQPAGFAVRILRQLWTARLDALV
jgi:hypothetical protein